ncbi:MAG: type IV pilus biogenesis/stability protein PilW [Gammaproteobacteria bacterium]|jgi:type IV pilus assembly protein PilF|nr:type IV pilus biogenesis/stability protein PilW [Gammaproteobacteria bacterium]
MRFATILKSHWFRSVSVLSIIFVLLNGCASTGMDKDDKNFKAADTNLQLGIGYMRQGRYEDALEKLQKAVEAKRDYADVHSALALVYERLLEYDKAGHHYREAIDLAPHDGGNYNNYGVFLCRQGEYKKADKYFAKAIETPRYKTPERAMENAGACAKQIPDLEKAEQYLRSALSINPKLPLALSEMADVMYQKENYMSTRAYLQRFGEVSKYTPKSLWLGIQTERKLGDDKAEARYAKLLQTQYPDSLEFKRWLEETP